MPRSANQVEIINELYNMGLTNYMACHYFYIAIRCGRHEGGNLDLVQLTRLPGRCSPVPGLAGKKILNCKLKEVPPVPESHDSRKVQQGSGSEALVVSTVSTDAFRPARKLLSQEQPIIVYYSAINLLVDG